jgi:hypothetical protein
MMLSSIMMLSSLRANSAKVVHPGQSGRAADAAQAPPESELGAFAGIHKIFSPKGSGEAPLPWGQLS